MNRSKGIIDLLILGILAVVVLVAAGYFLFGQSFMGITDLSKQIGLPFATPSNNNDITTLEKDINTTELDSIGSDLTNLEKELDASLTE